VTVCELPHESAALARAWEALCEHTARNAPDLVLLPEFAMLDAVWEVEERDPTTWTAIEAISDRQLERLGELGAGWVVATRPASRDGHLLNQGYLRGEAGLAPLRSKFFLPNQPGNWEARWFDRGDPAFPVFQAGELSFGLSICTELWAVETWVGYSAAEAHAILTPRATAAATVGNWMALGRVAAMRSGAYSISSNRVDASGACGGVGWVISPTGEVLARTSPGAPFATVEIDLTAPAAARRGYPGYVFREPPALTA
jgi:predicted amidohydrolase